MKINQNAFMLGLISIILSGFLLISCHREEKVTRERLSFNEDWLFILGDSAVYMNNSLNDTDWRRLNVPHDWSIEGEFNKDNPSRIEGGALPGGIGWYRKNFNVPTEDSGKRIYITFDGVYHNSEVYLNGNLLGKRPNGYIGFQYDMTPYLKFGNQNNVLAVRVDNSDQPNSRWYSGSGIYRNVWIEKTNPIHINFWGTQIVSNSVTTSVANLTLSIAINNTTSKTQQLKVETIILDENNQEVEKINDTINALQNDTSFLSQTIEVKNPKLWSTKSPYLYKAVSNVYANNVRIDSYETPFGIRFFQFDAKKGFSLNGESMKIKGVCNHHDLGALGAAINTRAIERQLEILKEMGCNAIRTSHNPPAPELLDLCDKMGFLVMDETFDMWAKKKVEFDYSTQWAEWHVRDLTDHILRDRNHPSVIIWSIGNEIPEQFDSTGISIAQELSSIIKKMMPGVMVTSGLNFPVPENLLYKSGALDLVGFNYHHTSFDSFPINFPNQKFIGTETTSSLNSRGVYNMPSNEIRVWPKRWDIPFYEGNPDNSCSSYDNCHAPWGSTHADAWIPIRDNDFLSGMFIWTGFDYLGEPTPYQWPSRSSYFGIVDLAGFPKDAYYMYQSEWTNKPVLHLFPHWNWNKGDNVDVWVYTNCLEVELFLNGKSLGKKSKDKKSVHLEWTVPFEEGTLLAVGKQADGSTMMSDVKTAGKPSKVILEADRSIISADGNDLAFITVSVKDATNNLVSFANNKIEFKVGEGLEIVGVDNGSQTSHESFKAHFRNAFNGKCLLIVKASKTPGIVSVSASSQGLTCEPISIELK